MMDPRKQVLRVLCKIRIFNDSEDSCFGILNYATVLSVMCVLKFQSILTLALR